jgi:glycosyltransferase involved in cell wall biosynthesis
MNGTIISIITVCRNAQDSIGSTIGSVQSQSYPYIEHVIQDGNSIDRTIEIASKLANQRTCIVSEPDAGIYNAMNKAIGRATGEVLFFLNAGDRLYTNDVVECVMAEFKSGADFVYGAIADPTTVKIYPEASKRYLYHDAIAHQCAFYRAKLFADGCCYDERYAICADYDHMLSFIDDPNVVKRRVDKTIAYFNRDGVSSINREQLFRERQLIVSRRYSCVGRLVGLTYWAIRRMRHKFTRRIGL